MTSTLSPDGYYYWDGEAWQSTMSADGLLKWNGSAWLPVADYGPNSELVTDFMAKLSIVSGPAWASIGGQLEYKKVPEQVWGESAYEVGASSREARRFEVASRAQADADALVHQLPESRWEQNPSKRAGVEQGWRAKAAGRAAQALVNFDLLKPIPFSLAYFSFASAIPQDTLSGAPVIGDDLGHFVSTVLSLVSGDWARIMAELPQRQIEYADDRHRVLTQAVPGGEFDEYRFHASAATTAALFCMPDRDKNDQIGLRDNNGTMFVVAAVAMAIAANMDSPLRNIASIFVRGAPST